MAPVLKTGVPKGTVGSNPTPSVLKSQSYQSLWGRYVMGHSLAIHHNTYHRWLDQSDVAAVAAALQKVT